MVANFLSPIYKSPFRGKGFMKYTQTTLEKTEKILEESGYVIRYERGSFQSGYCILEQRKVVVLNKFLQTEGRINTLIDIIPQLKVDAELLTPEIKKLYDQIILRQANEIM
ncbi:MAG TPA: hypothetical protein VHZ50_05695 [Puia sp.]|nr:hypothetical protein [Puia sp.]